MAVQTNLSPTSQGEMAAYESTAKFSDNPFQYGTTEHTQWYVGFLQSTRNIFRMQDLIEDPRRKITDIGSKHYSHMILEDIDNSIVKDEA